MKYFRQSPLEDEYADLRYDPNWRTNLEGAQFLNRQEMNLSFDESEDLLEPLENIAFGSRQQYVVIKNPELVQMDHAASSAPSGPFHLHLQNEDRFEHPVSSARSSVISTQDQVRTKKFSQYSPSPRPVREWEDIVERNKATLGINNLKQGSYLKAHQQKDKPDAAKQTKQTSYETISTHNPESQDNVQDPERIWLQKTQKLKSYKVRKTLKKKEQYDNSDQLKTPVPESIPQQNPKLITQEPIPNITNQSQGTTMAFTHDPPQSHSHAAPTVNFNINLHSPANPAQPLNISQKETIFTLVSQALQIPRIKVPSSPDMETSQFPPQHFVNNEQIMGSYLSTLSSGFYPVLPPISRPNGRDVEVGSNTSELRLNPNPGSSSDGYLSQMEKHKQLKTKANYKIGTSSEAAQGKEIRVENSHPVVSMTNGLSPEKPEEIDPIRAFAYSLKDYKSLKQEVKLGGLGPANVITDVLAEKIRRQKLYSNVIREQNKKISRIPSLSAKDPVGSDNKDAVPRRKALEYAKSIAKPKPPPKARDRDREQSLSMLPQHLQGTDPVHLATQEMLRRHEEEKRAVARFRSIHTI
ncbi:hypothetical protein DNTS_018357 [Danionella cerebrum]|uniref:Jhy protein homolog n=1 Tax=Danionella cerebrum TaxID=2873325 RepID=A0A553QKW3_9TELE|nr:hypothetical protein DNTS_018357 [Danionella translucida]